MGLVIVQLVIWYDILLCCCTF